MLGPDTREYIRSYFEEELEDSKRNVYFDQYFSTRSVEADLIKDLLEDIFDQELDDPRELEDGSLLFTIGNEPILFHQISTEKWLVVYSTAIRDRDKKDISDLAGLRGWIIEAWVPSNVVEGIYHELTPSDDSVNLQRKWDPYWIYQREGEVPEELIEYYDKNIDEFVEREIEFSIKTPRRLVDEALKMGATEELLDRSEISKSRFSIQVPSSEEVQSDGGVLTNYGTETDSEISTVTVRETAKIAHNSGDVDATFYLLDEIRSRSSLNEEFEKIVGNREYEKNEDGSLELVSYSEPRILKVVFEEKKFNPEASIKLANLLTVGQDDVDVHGVEKYRGELEFIVESYTVFDNGEYDIIFTGQDGQASLFIRPVNASVSGLVYLYQKLRQKFDPRVEWEIEDELPELKGD